MDLPVFLEALGQKGSSLGSNSTYWAIFAEGAIAIASARPEMCK